MSGKAAWRRLVRRHDDMIADGLITHDDAGYAEAGWLRARYEAVPTQRLALASHLVLLAHHADEVEDPESVRAYLRLVLVALRRRDPKAARLMASSLSLRAASTDTGIGEALRALALAARPRAA